MTESENKNDLKEILIAKEDLILEYKFLRKQKNDGTRFG